MGDCLITRKGGSSKVTEKTLEALGFVNVPKGEWALKTGSLATSSLNQSTYIPLAVYGKVTGPATTTYGSTTMTCTYSGGTKSLLTATSSSDAGGLGNKGTGTATGTVDLISVFSGDLTLMKSITGFSNASDVSIKTWLQKVS